MNEFFGEPSRTLCSELRGDNTVIPDEAWCIHGEPVEELDMGYPTRDPLRRHLDLENISEREFFPHRYDHSEEEKEANRDPEWDPNRVAEAGDKLIGMLGLFRTYQMEEIVACYMGRLEGRMDAVVHHCLNNRRNRPTMEAGEEFARKIAGHSPVISQKARDRLVAEAQREGRLPWFKTTKGPIYRFGEAVYGPARWKLLLRA